MPTTIHHCPICDWTHVEPAVHVPADALAGVFGRGVMSTVADIQRMERIERAIAQHIGEHSAVDFVQALTTMARAVHRRETTQTLMGMSGPMGYSGFSTDMRRKIERAAGVAS